MLLELWRKDNGEAYIKVYYRNGDEVFHDITSNITGCEKDCSFVKFVERSLPYKAQPSLAEVIIFVKKFKKSYFIGRQQRIKLNLTNTILVEIHFRDPMALYRPQTGFKSPMAL